MSELNYVFKVHNNLYIGGYWPSLDFQRLKEIGIIAIVNLMEENVYDPRPHGFAYLYRGINFRKNKYLFVTYEKLSIY